MTSIVFVSRIEQAMARPGDVARIVTTAVSISVGRWNSAIGGRERQAVGAILVVSL